MELMNGFTDVFIDVNVGSEFPNMANLTRLLCGCMHCTVCSAAYDCMHCYAEKTRQEN